MSTLLKVFPKETLHLEESFTHSAAVQRLFVSALSIGLVQWLLAPLLFVGIFSGRGTRSLRMAAVAAVVFTGHTIVAETSMRNASTTFRFSVFQVRGGSSVATSVQLSEWALFGRDGVAVNMLSATSIANLGSNSTQAPARLAIDGDLGTNSHDANQGGLVVEFESPIDVGSYDWATSSSDVNAHDPIRFTLDALVDQVYGWRSTRSTVRRPSPLRWIVERGRGRSSSIRIRYGRFQRPRPCWNRSSMRRKGTDS